MVTADRRRVALDARHHCCGRSLCGVLGMSADLAERLAAFETKVRRIVASDDLSPKGAGIALALLTTTNMNLFHECIKALRNTPSAPTTGNGGGVSSPNQQER